VSRRPAGPIPTRHPVAASAFGQPRVYGTPDQFARLLENLAALVDREPPETFAHGDVRNAAGQLAQTLDGRLGEIDA
jgi:hypothetical protein